MSIKDEIIKEIREGVAGLKYKNESIQISNVYPGIIEEALGDFDNGYELNGYDCDYWASIGTLEIYGCMRYGNATFTKTDGPIKKERPNKKEEDVYKRTSCTLKDGYHLDHIPIAEKVLHEDHQALIDDGLEPFYITFVFSNSTNMYVIIYAKDNNDARMRAFSIWDRRWDSIYDAAGWKKKKEYYGERFNKEFVEKEGPYALCY